MTEHHADASKYKACTLNTSKRFFQKWSVFGIVLSKLLNYLRYPFIKKHLCWIDITRFIQVGCIFV